MAEKKTENKSEKKSGSKKSGKSDEVVREGDMIYLDFEGYIKDSDRLFETTSEELARENDIFDEKMNYGPVPVNVGKGSLFPGLEEALSGSPIGEEREVDVPPEKAAGPREKDKMEVFPIREFHREKIDPYPGLEVTIRNRTGTVVSVGAGRVRVDFNNPLAGKVLKYRFKVVSRITDTDDMIKALLKMDYGHEEEFRVEHDKEKIELVLPDICKYDQNWMVAKYRLISDLRDVGFNIIRLVEEYVSEKKEEIKDESAGAAEKSDSDVKEEKAPAADEANEEKKGEETEAEKEDEKKGAPPEGKSED